jgi:hypothetical protein
MNVLKHGVAILVASILSTAALAGSTLSDRLKMIDAYKSPGSEAEISGIWPAGNDQYYALVNKRPPYRYGQQPVIDPKYYGTLVTADRDGKILKSVPVANDDFGGLVVVDGKFYAALTEAAEIVEFNPDNGDILRRIALPSPAGGLEYDPDRGAFIAQLYVGHPHLAVVDRVSGRVTETLWSEESAMGLSKVNGDWLCTWASGWDPGSFSELRLINQKTGHVDDRIMLDKVHSSMAPVLPDRKQFIVLVTTDSATGATEIRKYAYARDKLAATMK